ncbi:hypothetical protein [Pseudoxanthomonas sp. PXM01]|uniref:hypothetical protein n=1 Tax=Pseudoxanthomonas sp. PXM01 TaxID=2769295 RepID=UPI001787679B|nr:hypothetical protein [Pseudoxanthomonas sp. PXM01]MBD9468113.1 hypothetical protein [Pseudoxanthomonas sp. PXM01]
MEEGLSMLAALTAALSAAGLYAGSRHCRWTSWRRIGRAGTWGGTALAVASLLLWTQVLGAGAGFCAMLGSWMFAMIVLPYIAGMRVEHAARGDG